jgi:hypothetical protein
MVDTVARAYGAFEFNYFGCMFEPSSELAASVPAVPQYEGTSKLTLEGEDIRS